ncbi:unnamed protein product, partial [Phaeothamnion confervicola]
FLHVANVGDCRAVICRGGAAVELTRDHKPTRADEAARVEAAGGYISRGRLNGVLGVTRSFGDLQFKLAPAEGRAAWVAQQLTARPEITSVAVTSADAFLLLACDGVWDVMTSQQAVNYVQRRLLAHRDVQRASRELCQKAIALGSGDNCSCVLACLNQARGR